MEQNAEYVSGKVITSQYSVHQSTLRRWESDGRIKCKRMLGGKRLYCVADIKSIFGDRVPTVAKPKAEETPTVKRVSVCYARVSSRGQLADLERQKTDLGELYPDHEIVEDVGSGLNWKRKGFQSLLDRVYEGQISRVVVMHKDRLCRFGFELVEWIFQKHGVQFVVHGKADTTEDSQELADDLLAVVNVFVARRNGKRSAENRRRRAKSKLEKVSPSSDSGSDDSDS